MDPAELKLVIICSPRNSPSWKVLCTGKASTGSPIFIAGWGVFPIFDCRYVSENRWDDDLGLDRALNAIGSSYRSGTSCCTYRCTDTWILANCFGTTFVQTNSSSGDQDTSSSCRLFQRPCLGASRKLCVVACVPSFQSQLVMNLMTSYDDHHWQLSSHRMTCSLRCMRHLNQFRRRHKILISVNKSVHSSPPAPVLGFGKPNLVHGSYFL